MGIRVALNGFGRLGRSIARVIMQSQDVELTAINDVSSWEILTYLFERDSIHQNLGVEVSLNENVLHTPKGRIVLFNQAESKKLKFDDVDVVIEASGKFLDSKSVEHHLCNGAKRVIISAPSLDDTPTFVMGVNHHLYAGEKIISNASCTTNALAPICKILDTHFGIESGILSTIHAYTNDQNLLDNAHRSDKRRSRAAGINIIPTTTGSAKAIGRVIPSLEGKLHGHSLRVPVADVSMIDLAVKVCKDVRIEELNELFASYACSSMDRILKIDENFGVSSDFIGESASSVIAKDLSFVLCQKYLKIMAWYDNEWGYANRIVEMARLICE